ncbi:unnamed protein product, partial [Amoebophrya sp. A25]
VFYFRFKLSITKVNCFKQQLLGKAVTTGTAYSQADSRKDLVFYSREQLFARA